MSDAITLEVQAAHLQREIRAHKSAIRHHRARLAAAKTALTQLEAECRRRGIRLVVVEPQHGEAKEYSHGPRTGTSSPRA